MNKRMRPRVALQHVTRVARKHGYRVEQLRGRGEGSHAVYVLLGEGDNEVGRFGLTGHGDREPSWTMMRQIGDGLAHLFSERWMER